MTTGKWAAVAYVAAMLVGLLWVWLDTERRD
jgi:hypothetical protein